MTSQKADTKTVLAGLLLGWLAVGGMGLTNAFVFWANWSFIVSGNGAGVFSVVFYVFALMLTGVVWSISFWLYRNKALAILYWLVCLAPLPVFLFFPVWFQAPSLS
ncbi:hypothetical protein ACFOZ5_11620 [Marinobacter lacisalsi]|uniref:Iron uptake protein n=1 Tax=Marinobacter lacisalsi TaxID=475979 RepID=A0ABV8QJW7_9GAMM